MRRLLIITIFLFIGCGSLQPTIVRFSDLQYHTQKRVVISTPYQGGNIFRYQPYIGVDGNWLIRNQSLGLSDIYYNNQFLNLWWIDYRWRFDNHWRTLPPRVAPRVNAPVRQPITNPNPRPRPPRREIPMERVGRRNNTRVTSNVPRTPNRRTNVQPSRQNNTNNSPTRQSSRRLIKNN